MSRILHRLRPTSRSRDVVSRALAEGSLTICACDCALTLMARRGAERVNSSRGGS
jgi:hypothetical protein